MWIYFVLVFLLLLFAFVDTWYFLRSIINYLPSMVWQKCFGGRKIRQLSRDELLQATSVEGIVLPSDLDFHFHMNNSKYLREMDFGRFNHYTKTGIFRHILSMGGAVVVAAVTIRYRRSLHLWERFSLETKILCWEGNTLYLEQRFVRKKDRFVCAVALLSMSTLRVSLERVLEKVCGDAPMCPTPPPEVTCWADSIAKSKEHFRRERTN